LALDGSEDGLAAYREIIPASQDLLAPGGLIALEVGQASIRPSILLTGIRGAGQG
jgi:methylase of polypeptide subunit release factors